MLKYTFIVLLMIHVLSDFYSHIFKDTDEKNIYEILIHVLEYTVSFIIIVKTVMPGLFWKYIWALVIGHGILEGVMFAYENHGKKGEHFQSTRKALIVKQLIYIAIIFVILYSIEGTDILLLYNGGIRNLCETLGISETAMLDWSIKLLIIHKPVNVLISNILSEFRPKEEENIPVKNAGRLIGTLERIIMVILISINQYSAVGLVLTAKSIARYDKISKEQEFAEYYLLGTLLSTICAVVIALIF